MTRRLAWVLLAAATALGLTATWVAARRDRGTLPDGTGAEHAHAADPSAAETRVRVQLYFPSADGRLAVEPRELAGSADPSVLVARIVEGLLEGPRSERSLRPFPPEVTVGETFLAADGIAYVDLRSPAHPAPPFQGSTAELLVLYSLVNSVVENVDGARSLVVLWNGRQPRTFGGHIDTSRPLLPDPSLVAS